ncbi:MAG: di-heme oxidoredictase family protein [Planctomycetota bacterium]
MKRWIPLVGLALTVFLGTAHAVSPDAIHQGRELFEKEWPSRSPSLGSDGLGPLFNARSCVACHNQGGVGGGGGTEFNAKSIGIEKIRISGGPITKAVIANCVSKFHPGFILPSGDVINALAISHHGGSQAYVNQRMSMLAKSGALFDVEGGPVDASEVRQALNQTIVFRDNVGAYSVEIHARFFQRNTSSLFGAGLIDQVTDRQLDQVMKIQKAHPEISGRPSTLINGTLGRFGWRGNLSSLLDFVDQACANEVGLETKRRPQGSDPHVPQYRNPSIDISDAQIQSMERFVAALPAPQQRMPSDSLERKIALRGQDVFASVGCAVCHVPSIGPAKGVYSDLLLHDMGRYSMDLNHAEPYIKNVSTMTIPLQEDANRSTGTQMVGGYYGPATLVTRTSVSGSSNRLGPGFQPSGRIGRRMPQSSREFTFVAPEYPTQLVSVATREQVTGAEAWNTRNENGLGDVGYRKSGSQTSVRVEYESTLFNQEWRTPPLWGVADTAPYLHDGRASTLLEAITLHGGEAEGTTNRFLSLPLQDREAVIAFLETLVAPENAPQPSI